MSKYVWIALIMLPLHFARAEEPASGSADLSTSGTTEVPVTEAPASTGESVAGNLSTEQAAEPEAPKVPTFVVVVPERIDHNWYWTLHSDRSQHIVQSAIEKALTRAGVEVIDLVTAQGLPGTGMDPAVVQTLNYALSVGKKVNADYVISGQATAVKSSEGTAYNVNVVRTQAEITAKIIRTQDGKILTVEDASAFEGGQSAQAAGQNALKKAGTAIASQLAREARKIAAGTATPAP